MLTDSWLGSAFAEVPSEIGHGAEVGHPTAIDPLKDLPAMKPRDPHGCEMAFNLCELELGRVGANGGGHVGVPASQPNPPFYYALLPPSGTFLP